MDITVTNRRLIPSVVNTFQFENETTTLEFALESYIVDEVDLRDYDCYVVTSQNGVIDMIQIPTYVDGTKLIATWDVQEYTLTEKGAILFQLAFKENIDNELDTGVWYSYKGVLINRESIDADDHISASYPTILKQWLDLINARTGSLTNKIVYMPVDSPVDIDKRNSANLYYQWEEQPRTVATNATGQINLGSMPYADSGLYINNTHIYVEGAEYVLDPEVWVTTINNANVGVVATNDSTESEVIINLMASTAGTVGNTITYQLGVATEGVGKGQINPSGGSTIGTVLSGGADAAHGVENPMGHFEDHFGNYLTIEETRLVHTSGDEEIHDTKTFTTAPKVPTGDVTLNDTSVVTSEWVKNILDNRRPDFANKVPITPIFGWSTTYETNVSGWVFIEFSFYGLGDASWSLYFKDDSLGIIELHHEQEHDDSGYNTTSMKMIPIWKGASIGVHQSHSGVVDQVYFIPAIYSEQ